MQLRIGRWAAWALPKSLNCCCSRTRPDCRECGSSSVLGRRWRICIYMLASFGLEHRAHLLKLLERRALDPRELQVEAVHGLGQASWHRHAAKDTCGAR